MVTIYIDDQAYEVENGKNVLEAALNAGLDLPYFCWHPAMGSVGACRQCALVQFRDEQDTQGRIVMGCMTAVSDGARFSMQSNSATTFRENIVESLMLNHPHDCPVCAEGGECHLQDMTVMVGHRDRRYRGKKNTHRNQNLGPLINHEMNRCITCYRCTRFYQDYAGGKDLAAHAAHDHVYFGRHQEGTLESEFAGNLVEVCPTGVFTDKPLVNDYTRKWDMQSAPSVCGGCALGCNTIPSERYGELKRVHNRYNNDVNGYFLCDRGRYGHDYVNNESRLNYPGLRDENERYDAIDSAHALDVLAGWFANGNVAAIGSPRGSIESNYLLKELVGADNFCAGFSDQEDRLVDAVLDNMQHASANIPTMKQMESADAVLILGEDVTNTAPRVALALRQSVRNKAKEMAAELHIPEWQDDAIRTLAQDQRNPLYIAALSDTRLDDVATGLVHDDVNGVARFGYAIATELDSNLPAVTGLNDVQIQMVQDVANSLREAKCALVVSGTGCQSVDVINAASVIADALHRLDGGDGTMLSYCVPEANTIGQGMLKSPMQPTLTEIVERGSTIDTLIVMENDLFRRAPYASIEALINNVTNLVVIDALPNATMEQASLVLPAATLVESEGTFVNFETRAQRHYPVFLASEQRSPSWQWLTRVGQALNKPKFKAINNFDDVLEACAKATPALAGITEAAPSATYKNRGVKIPRQPHRYSGRTAMRANISVHEPKQPDDAETPFSYSMEGQNGSQPSALLSFVWSPGWNSNQSLHKFQSEVGGALNGGPAGHRLLVKQATSNRKDDCHIPELSEPASGQLLLLPNYHIFGSEELSAQSAAIKQLIPPLTVEVNIVDAERFDVNDGGFAHINIDDQQVEVVVRINNSVKIGCALVPVGLPSIPFLTFGSMSILSSVPLASSHRGQHV